MVQELGRIVQLAHTQEGPRQGDPGNVLLPAGPDHRRLPAVRGLRRGLRENVHRLRPWRRDALGRGTDAGGRRRRRPKSRPAAASRPTPMRRFTSVWAARGSGRLATGSYCHEPIGQQPLLSVRRDGAGRRPTESAGDKTDSAGIDGPEAFAGSTRPTSRPTSGEKTLETNAAIGPRPERADDYDVIAQSDASDSLRRSAHDRHLRLPHRELGPRRTHLRDTTRKSPMPTGKRSPSSCIWSGQTNTRRSGCSAMLPHQLIFSTWDEI